MRMLSKNKRESVDITFSELIDRYIGKNYISIDYKPNGVVNVWISDSIKEKSSDKDKSEDDLK